jgi:hypothetical protein
MDQSELRHVLDRCYLIAHEALSAPYDVDYAIALADIEAEIETLIDSEAEALARVMRRSPR